MSRKLCRSQEPFQSRTKPIKQSNQIEIEDEKEDIVIYLGTRDSEGEAPEETFSAPIEVEQNITLGIPSDDLNPDRKLPPNGKFLVLRLGTDVAKKPDVFAIVLNTQNPQHKKQRETWESNNNLKTVKNGVKTAFKPRTHKREKIEMAIFNAYSAKNPRKVREKEKRDRGEREKKRKWGRLLQNPNSGNSNV